MIPVPQRVLVVASFQGRRLELADHRTAIVACPEDGGVADCPKPHYTCFGIIMVSQPQLPELAPLKPIRWVGAKEEVKALPRPVQREIGFALLQAQLGEKHPGAKPLRGFGGASVLEIVEDHDKETYRALYTVKFDPVVYVLHAFHKKSKTGIATPKAAIALIKRRLASVKEFHDAPPVDLTTEIASYRAALAVHELKQRDRGSRTGGPVRMRKPI